MAYSTDKPEPPAKTESVSVFGLDNGVWRLAFLGSYFGACALTLPSTVGCSLGQLFMLHSWWFLFACYMAKSANGLVCELVDEEKQRAHARALTAWMTSRPIRFLERKHPDGELEPVYAPERARPLLDPEMGVRIRA